MTRLKLAELTSGIGALVLGVGVGTLFADWFAGGAGPIVLVGAVAHAFGMWDKHRLERHADAAGQVWAGLYWICWVLLAGLVVFLTMRS